jgi:glyoxylase-like metal-dependent hydrolase (beta-lactamase superfamily II)
MRPTVTAFFDEPTNTISYVVADPATGACAIVDPVLDFDAASGRTRRDSANAVAAFIARHGLSPQWILETHVHADHLSAGAYLKTKLGARLAIGDKIAGVEAVFAPLFGLELGGGASFDHLFADDEAFEIGRIQARALSTPGHTPACMTYVIGDAAFVGDTLFMPDYGTARCDFPGGDAATLYRSIRRIFALPPETRLFMCHDYKAPGREEYRWETNVAEQRRANIHARDSVSEAEFVALREARDKTLSMPKLLIPSVQVNIRGGSLPAPDPNGVRYLKLPLDTF